MIKNLVINTQDTIKSALHFDFNNIHLYKIIKDTHINTFIKQNKNKQYNATKK